MPTFKDHFSTRSAQYAAHRPSYPRELANFLADVAPARELALDCGCGNGQLSTLLADRFARVVAIDASSEQIAHAAPHDRVEYRVAPAEHNGLADGCADLITTAQAVHWFDLDAFYAEVRRVARPRGVLALVTYGVLRLEDEACDRLLWRFYAEDVDRFWPPERRIVEDGYRSLPFPFAEIAAPQLAIEASWNLDAVVGYVSTWSAVKAAANTLGRDPSDNLRDELAQLWGAAVSRRRVRWPLALRVGRL
ncbi:MAG TPA: class I SAM-dependent methyltransferase [Methylocystis sp.]|nr:class I SAM-dependent methyltransferase [Methylocystis sp.]